MNTKLCPNCSAEIPDHAPGKLCPGCVLRGADEVLLVDQSAPSLDAIAAAFPDLEILSFIGQGGMGSVYQVRQPELERTSALKILSPALSDDPAFAERFAREARVMGKLKHPNIVTIFESGESGGYFYLLMEYVDGVNLRQAMQAGRFSPEQALAVVPGICDALQAAHSEGVWHRDIKPENILLDKEGEIKIVDFGIARLVGDPQRNFTLTVAGQALGSSAYMAPEQHEKPHEVDHRADIYSMGVVIYELLTGELPLGRFPSPGERSEVDARIDEIVLRTLEKERELRQQSATEVKTDLQDASLRKGGERKSVPAKEPSFIFRDSDRFFITSLGLWLGGWVAVGVGGFTSPVLVGFGCLAVLFGFIGCWWILWRIRKGAHPAKYRSVLLALVFWPCVCVLSLLPIRIWLVNTVGMHYSPPLLSREWWSFSSALYAIAGIITPLIMARTLWRMFAQKEGGVRRRRWPVVAAILVVIAALPLEQFVRDRKVEADTSFFVELEFQQKGAWADEGHYFKEALADLSETTGHAVKVSVNPPQNVDLVVDYKSERAGGALLEWRSQNRSEGNAVKSRCIENLRASLHDRFTVNETASGVGSDQDRGGGMNYEKPLFFRSYVNPTMGVLAFLACFVVMFLVTSGGWSGVMVTSLTALVMAGILGKVDWPGLSPGATPVPVGANDIAIIPEPKFNYVSTRDAIASHIKAAKSGDQTVFEAHLSARLKGLVTKLEGDVSGVMSDWKSLSYAHQIDGDDERMRVRLNGSRKEKGYEAYLVKREHDWQIDSLFPIPRFDVDPLKSAQKLVAASQAKDRLRFVERFTSSLVDEIPEDGAVEHQHAAMDYFSRLTDLSIKSDDGRRGYVWLHFDHPEFSSPEAGYEMIKEDGIWKFTGVSRSPTDPVGTIVSKLLAAVKEGDEKSFAECLSKELLESISDLDSAMAGFVKLRLISTQSDGDTATVVLRSTDGGDEEVTFMMKKEEGEWKFSSEGR